MINKEYLERAAILEELKKFPYLRLAGTIIKNVEAVCGVEEVTYCKDCIYRFEDKDGNYYPENIFCGLNCDDGYKEYDYCSKGKKRE